MPVKSEDVLRVDERMNLVVYMFANEKEVRGDLAAACIMVRVYRVLESRCVRCPPVSALCFQLDCARLLEVQESVDAHPKMVV